MKLLLLALLVIPSFAHAGPEQCEPTARGQAKTSVDALVYIAREFHKPEDQKYLQCEGKQLKFNGMTQEIGDFGDLYYSYHYSIDCGFEVLKYSEWFYWKNGRCELRGE